MITCGVLAIVGILSFFGIIGSIGVLCSSKGDDDAVSPIYYILFILGCIVIGTASILGTIKLISTGGEIFGYTPPIILELVVYVLIIAIVITIIKCVNKANDNKAIKKRLAMISSGKWEFPVEEFYNQCVNQNIKDTSSDFSIKKMILVAKAIMKNNEIPEEYFHLYCNEDIVKKYYKEGNKQSILTAKKKKEEEELEWITPKNSNLTPEMLEHREIINAIKDLLYSEKKRVYLSLLIKSKKNIISEAEKAIESVAVLCNALIESSQEKKIDVATVGGLANGLGGVGASMMAMQDAMIENEKIEIQNQQIYDHYVEQYGPVYAEAQAKYQPIIQKATSDIKKYSKLLDELSLKVYFEDCDTNKLFENLKVSGSISHVEEDCICAKIKITNFNVPEDESLNIAIDGILKAKLYCDDILVDEFYVALPPNGISSEACATVIQYPQKYMLGKKRSYRFEFSPHNLWLMEK